MEKEESKKLKEEIKKFIKENYPNGFNADCFEEVDVKNRRV